ncbi:bifunctional 5,10-methylenetetrahydrofolate dehydrogenase/5,10-methenyltetrahydrofolate cyclohydrolase [[Mycoplasma] gypis]|uniref:Bifunctional protein FolD n=1 Tax=[Mycoplasma] gypis TaxID=92404 RepID=A0ABZ2RPN0_9BACT|nr:bifunctional 5,10-methylenetetrahydrofolate dehydrogenase/5,10-methenyltetrahydrofolate cyclohydrolase [[Mycoplasma] gypis]MBN0919246.1 bifunctional 5,10-methylenetetrahydrofolate dehydrogenase/5,10-methenyltetrahydrofolate cyclohydrolase [[Mycoplasma] gypis]
MVLILDGKTLSQKIQENISQIMSQNKFTKVPSLAIIQVDQLFESNIYVKNKINTALKLGFKAELFVFEKDVKQDYLINEIKRIQKEFDGIIVQLPLPKHLDKDQILNTITPEKDIDGLTLLNNQKLENNQEAFLPATALGIYILLKSYNINIKNTNIGIVGESKIVGYPIKLALLKNNSKVTSYNKQTGISNLKQHDILIVAAGVKHLINAQHVTNNSVVIDVGIHRDTNNKITGDCDFEAIKNIVKAITPVPGGVGPMTIVSLIINLIVAFAKQNQDFAEKFNSIIKLSEF